MKVAKNLDESIIYHIYCAIVSIDVAEHRFETIAVVLFIQPLLIPVIFLDAPTYKR